MHFVAANRGCVGCVFEGSRNLWTFGVFLSEVVCKGPLSIGVMNHPPQKKLFTDHIPEEQPLTALKN